MIVCREVSESRIGILARSREWDIFLWADINLLTYTGAMTPTCLNIPCKVSLDV